VPAEFRRLFRKVAGWTAGNTVPEELAVALGNFEAAVRSGAPPAELEPLADGLEDSYDNARG
jgi:hypothetical protein